VLRLTNLEPVEASLQAMQSSSMQIETFLRQNDAPWEIIKALEFLKDEYKERFLDYETVTFSAVKKDDYEFYNRHKAALYGEKGKATQVLKEPAVFDNRLEKQTQFYRGFVN